MGSGDKIDHTQCRKWRSDLLIDLREALLTRSEWDTPSTDSCRVPDGFLIPGFWVVFSAAARANGVMPGQIQYPSGNHRTYAETLGLPKLLDTASNESVTRRTEGSAYARLTHLKGADAADVATSRINSCLRENLGGLPFQVQLASDLSRIVGELHDNVAAHTDAMGISMAQRFKEQGPYPAGIAFAIADLGGGFSRKLSQFGVDHRDDAEAIEWCLAEGRSTGILSEPKDDWAQLLPDDAFGNPYPDSIERAYGSANHHQGLGLAMLVRLVRQYRGRLEVASGNALYTVHRDGAIAIDHFDSAWDGVAISCRFPESGDVEGMQPDRERAVSSLRERFRTGEGQ
jgi:hypothetical protein